MHVSLRWTLALAALISAGCAGSGGEKSKASEPAMATETTKALEQAEVVLQPTQGNTCRGIVGFTQTKDGVLVVADIEGLTPGQQHAMHVHEKGDCSAPDASSAGSHYNPGGHPHALPPTDPRHAGDLGNLTADAQGKAHYEITVTNISVAGAMNPIVGLSVIVHAKVDDASQPVGNAGGRIACGVIARK